jgi:L-lactate utilization protein LutB
VQDEQRIAQLTEAIAQLKARFPKHSVPPAMMIELEELEEELQEALGGQGHEPDPRFIL